MFENDVWEREMKISDFTWYLIENTIKLFFPLSGLMLCYALTKTYIHSINEMDHKKHVSYNHIEAPKSIGWYSQKNIIITLQSLKAWLLVELIFESLGYLISILMLRVLVKYKPKNIDYW